MQWQDGFSNEKYRHSNMKTCVLHCLSVHIVLLTAIQYNLNVSVRYRVDREGL
jgi:hypothetical protein